MSENHPAWMEKILASKKYHRLGLTEETLHDLMLQVQTDGVPSKLVEKTIREKLHNIVAPYLETVNYQKAMLELSAIPLDDQQQLQEFARKMLLAHTSTAERMEILQPFYAYIVSQLPAKTPLKILDMACGLNPFAIPWMQLPIESTLLAYDLNGVRVELMNLFFQKGKYAAQAIHADILVHVPDGPADAAFLFKEAHRFEQRQKGSTRQFLEKLPAPLIFVSLPARNMTGRHDLSVKHTRLVEEAIAGKNWQLETALFGTELLFTIRK